VERVHRGHERLHGQGGIRGGPLDPRPGQLEVPELGDRQAGQGRLVIDRLGQRSIFRHPEERRQRAVGEQPQQVDDPVGGRRRDVRSRHAGSVTMGRPA
jgi:hypothetical protein